ncbi:MAG: hypothetical protein M3318_07970, partial [Actinomycetota bacterium]|nr:hypothetical protein [Actinomycetota bacterium]
GAEVAGGYEGAKALGIESLINHITVEDERYPLAGRAYSRRAFVSGSKAQGAHPRSEVRDRSRRHGWYGDAFLRGSSNGPATGERR